jgi:hypothetical protein
MAPLPVKNLKNNKRWKSKTRTHFPNSRIEINEKKFMPPSPFKNKQK